MKLRYTVTSPFARKVVVAAIETGLIDRIELVPTSPRDPATGLAAENPLGKIPVMITDNGRPLFDSAVICEFLDGLHGDPARRLFPPAGPARWDALRLHALGDGMLDAATAVLMERRFRPEDKRWREGQDALLEKVTRSLDYLEGGAPGFGPGVDIGAIAIGCAIGYLDFRFAELEWRRGRGRLAGWYEALARRPSMTRSQPYDPA